MISMDEVDRDSRRDVMKKMISIVVEMICMIEFNEMIKSKMYIEWKEQS